MHLSFKTIVLPVAAAVLVAGAPSLLQAGGNKSMEFDPANFNANSVIINNSFWPLLPPVSFTYAAETGEDEECEFNTVRVLQRMAPDLFPPFNPKSIAGVAAITVYDVSWTTDCDDTSTPAFTAFEEVTFDWYFQDIFGKIWYGGEASFDCDEGDCELNDGSWEHDGVDSFAGIIMLAGPTPGDRYDQEIAEGAQDKAKVARVNAWLTLYGVADFEPFGDGDFHGCLKTKEWTPLERGSIEFKWYCPNDGLLRVDEQKGKTVRFERIEPPIEVDLPPTPFP